MTTIRPGDYIHHRKSYTIWRVTAVNPDGTLQVEFYAGLHHKLKVIKRPEEYRKVSEDGKKYNYPDN